MSRFADGIFDVSEIFGFLPIKDPLPILPSEYTYLQTILDKLPECVKTPDLLSSFLLDLPEYNLNDINDPFLAQALFRGYAFLSSFYLLEPSYRQMIIDGTYGKGLNFLPRKIAVPFVTIAKKLNVYPWLDYHYAYSMCNYVKKDKNQGLNWKNLDMAVSFSKSPDEVGFIMIHVYINELSNILIKYINKIKKGDTSQENFRELYRVMDQINSRRVEMWKASDHKKYNDFRTFIMGIKGNTDIFPSGVVYEGCFDNIPQEYRGQTGAQDNIIPVCDIFSGITNYYPENDLTKYLYDLRSYRPIPMQNYFEDLKNHFNDFPIFSTLKSTKNYYSMCYLLGIINEVYLFRNGHWQFVQKYIMENTKYDKATGGTPILSWIPNQIDACLKTMKDILDVLNEYFENEEGDEKGKYKEAFIVFKNINDSYKFKRELLDKQLEKLREKIYKPEEIFELNGDLKDNKNI